MPIHKRIAKEKLRKTYDINEMLDHLYDLFIHIGKDIAPVHFQSITKGSQKTIAKFSKKLKEMIKQKGDFYLPKSRSHSRDASPNVPLKKQSPETVSHTESNLNNKATEYNSNEIVIHETVKGSTHMAE